MIILYQKAKEETKQQGCLGIYSECGEVGAYGGEGRVNKELERHRCDGRFTHCSGRDDVTIFITTDDNLTLSYYK